MDVGVIGVIITGIFSILVALIQKARKENKEDHNMVYTSLQNLHDDVRTVGQKLDNHIDWHLKN
jgi:hypothetical protein